MKRLWLLLALCLLAFQPALADTFLTGGQLGRYGIQMSGFRLMTLSGNGRVLIGSEKEMDLKLRATGYGYKMRVFHFDGSGISTVDTIPLPVSVWDQTAINDDGTQAIISTELGARIYAVDLVSKTLHLLMQRKPGEPGFRNDPRIIWFDGQSFCMIGYYYDGNGIAGLDVVVRLDLSQDGVHIFQQLTDLLHVDKKTSPRYMLRIVSSPDQAVFLGPIKADGQELKLYYKGNVSVLDKGVVYGTVAATPGRVLYAIRRRGKIQHKETWLQDVTSNARWQIGKTDVPYQYGFISRDGKTVALSVFDIPHQALSMFYARQGDKFTVRPIGGLQAVRVGNFRLSKDGKTWAYLSSEGLRLGLLP
ncbi:MAG TPA: hypothetical protein VGO93_28970 [Candidatus Xenobia bacterium]